MKIFKCNHKWKVNQRSNALQLDEMGYPLRLYIVKCCKCGKYDQHWLDTEENALDELKIGESFLVNWF